MSLIFVRVPSDADRPLTADVVLSAWAGAVEAGNLGDALAAGKPVAVLLEDAETEISRRLGFGETLAAAVAAWAEMAADCVNRLSRHRRHVSLIDRRALAGHPAEVLAMLAERHGLPPAEGGPWTAQDLPQEPPVLRLAAAAAVQAIPALTELARKVESMRPSLTLPDATAPEVETGPAGIPPGAVDIARRVPKTATEAVTQWRHQTAETAERPVLMAELQRMQANVAQLRDDLAAAQTQGVANLEAALAAAAAQAQAERQLLMDQAKWMQADIAQLGGDLAAAQSRAQADLEAQKAAHDRTVAGLREDLRAATAALESSVAQAQAERQLLLDQALWMQADLAQLSRELVAAQSQTKTKLDAQKSAHDAEIAALTARLRERDEALASITDSARAERQRLLDQVRRLQADLDQRGKDLATAEAQAQATLDAERAAHGRTTATLTTRLRKKDESLAAAAEKARAARALLTGQVRAAQAELKALQKAQAKTQTGAAAGQAGLERQLAAEREQRLAVEARESALAAERDALRTRLRQAEAGLAQAQTHVEALLGSTSWRVTAPLRAIKSATARKPSDQD